MNLFDVYPREYVVNSLKYLSMLGEDLDIEYNNINSKFNTRRAHLGGYYAKDQNKYTQYSEAVFKAYFTLGLNVADKNVLNEIAKIIGLNISEMNEAIDSGKYTDKLMEDYKLAVEYKITSVPTFIINNKMRISGIKEYNEFKKYF